MNKNELKEKYELTELVYNEILQLQNIIAVEKNIELSFDEVINFLKCAMNLDDFQIFLTELQIDNIPISLNDEIELFFSEKSYLKILNTFDVLQNVNENQNKDNSMKLTKTNN